MKKCCGVHALRIAVGITMLALLLVGGAGAMTITVNTSGSGDYSRIQDAIDNASSGDTILVYSGTYYENVNVSKQLTLRGIGNPVVDAGGSGSAITLAADGITLEGFTATGSNGYYGSPEAGIKVTSSNNTVSGNNASNNYNGISLGSSNNNTLSGNNANLNKGFYGSGAGISLGSSSNNTLRGNMMTGNQKNFNLDGYTDSDFDNNIDTSNLVDGRPIYYIIKASDTTYDSSSNAGTLYCISCVNVTIKNLNKNSKGIFFWNTSQSRIQNVTASNNSNGISLFSSSNNTLSGNNASNNNNGIFLYYSSNNNTLSGNNASLNGDGGGISVSYSSNNTLTGNIASNNRGTGIYLYNSSNNTLIGNNASSNNGEDGEGISVSYSSNNTMSGNIASNNGGTGISLGGNNNILSGNNASNNDKGIDLDSSSNNKIYNNIFNNKHNVGLIESINTWNTTRQSVTNIIGGSILGGNLWTNSKGTRFSQICMDVNGDGICDKSYALDAKNIDYLPLAKDKIPPKSVRNLKNVTYARNYINWTWKDPKDIDFKKVMVFIDSKFKKNVSKGKRFYNATDFKPNTRHTISTWTVDMNGNINKTWTNHSAWTAK